MYLGYRMHHYQRGRNMRKFHAGLLVTVFSLILSACGGGDGGSTPSGPTAGGGGSGAPTPIPTPTSSPSTSSPTIGNGCAVAGDLEQWHRVEVFCHGPEASEANPATFTDYRFNVTFRQGDQVLLVPGHFAGDGRAANTGVTTGNIWRAYFSPPTTGEWTYDVSFRSGANIAVSTDPNQGQEVPLGAALSGSGRFTVGESSATGRDMRSKGLLQQTGDERYLRHAGTGNVFIEGGMDSPENIFGYDGFDNTTKHDNVNSCKGILHRFEPHEADWQPGDPTWMGDKGKSLIGLVNYIAGTGVNGVYVMAMTVNGDGCDAHPWVEYSGDRLAFDVSKLDQWEMVFSHMTAKGLLIHVMTQETENDQLLNGGDLGLERKLYYRELISRFGHHPALQWNLGEENTNTPQQQRAFSDFIKAMDPYKHPIFMHTFPNSRQNYEELLGHQTFDGPTLQFGGIPRSATDGLYGETVKWLTRSAQNGKQWVVTATEASGGQAPTPVANQGERQRVYWTWANIMAGGGGIEWYLKTDGAGHAYDLAVENLREFDTLWLETGYAVKFFNETLPNDFGLDLQTFARTNELTSSDNDWVLSDPGRAYLIFLLDGGSTTLNLPSDDNYTVHWYNPRNGELTEGITIASMGNQSIGSPPNTIDSDWLALVVNTSSGDGVHPDVVRTVTINASDVLQAPQSNWADSYSVGKKCYCASTLDHGIGAVTVNVGWGTVTVEEACDLMGPGPGASGRPKYNDVQCGNGPQNGQADENYCPGRVDMGIDGCGQIGPEWLVPEPLPIQYIERDGLIVMEAENTATENLRRWELKTDISGYTENGYLEFTGNNPESGSPNSPLAYRFRVTQGGLYYLHMHVAKEHLTIRNRLRTDVANDGYVRLEGDVGAGPNAGNSHGDDANVGLLTSNTKFFGGDHHRFTWATGNRLDPGGHNNKRVAVYRLAAGKAYTFFLSGRSQKFKVNRIVFRHESVGRGIAHDLDNVETRP